MIVIESICDCNSRTILMALSYGLRILRNTIVLHSYREGVHTLNLRDVCGISSSSKFKSLIFQKNTIEDAQSTVDNAKLSSYQSKLLSSSNYSAESNSVRSI